MRGRCPRPGGCRRAPACGPRPQKRAQRFARREQLQADTWSLTLGAPDAVHSAPHPPEATAPWDLQSGLATKTQTNSAICTSRRVQSAARDSGSSSLAHWAPLTQCIPPPIPPEAAPWNLQSGLRNQSPNKLVQTVCASQRDCGGGQFQGPRSMDAGALRVPDGLGDSSAAAGAREPRPARPRPAPGGRAPRGALGPGGTTWRCLRLGSAPAGPRAHGAPAGRPGAPRGPPAPPTALLRPRRARPAGWAPEEEGPLEGWRGDLELAGAVGGSTAGGSARSPAHGPQRPRPGGKGGATRGAPRGAPPQPPPHPPGERPADPRRPANGRPRPQRVPRQEWRWTTDAGCTAPPPPPPPAPTGGTGA